MDAYLAGSHAGRDEAIAGVFLVTREEARKFHVRDLADWIAVFDPASG